MGETRVAHIKDVDVSDDSAVYIGRANRFRRLATSIWANPYKIDETVGETRERVIERYEELMRSRLAGPEGDYWRAVIQILRGRTLACWCKPDHACHGDVLVKLLEEL